MDRSGIWFDPTHLFLESYKATQKMQEDIIRFLDRSRFSENMQMQVQLSEATFRSIYNAHAETMRQVNDSMTMFTAKYVDDINSIQNNLRAISERAIADASAYSALTASFKLIQSSLFDESWGKSLAERQAILFAAQSPAIQEDAHAEIQKLDSITTDLESTKDVTDFFAQLEDFIAKLPRPVKLLILFIILPFIRDIAFDIIKPKVQEFIFGAKDHKTSKEIKKVVSNSLGSQCPRELLRDIRFVTAESLIVREYPKKRSRRYGNLKFGDLVSVIQTKKSWTLIEFSPANSQGKIRGWVYSRYLGKFN